MLKKNRLRSCAVEYGWGSDLAMARRFTSTQPHRRLRTMAPRYLGKPWRRTWPWRQRTITVPRSPSISPPRSCSRRENRFFYSLNVW